jgi:hypothetical protein
MTVVASTVPAAKGALYDALTAWAWDGEQPDVLWGYPSETGAGSVFVCLGDTTFNSPAEYLADVRRQEAYTLQVICQVVNWGDDERETEERAWQLYANVIALLADEQDNPVRLEGAISHFADRTVRQRNVVSGPDQWLSQIVIEQGVVAYVPLT